MAAMNVDRIDGLDVGIFVHGYNYNFQQSLFRLAQMQADSGIDAVPILFAWQSEATITGYVSDRDSVTYSRDYLVELLAGLFGSRRHVSGRARMLIQNPADPFAMSDLQAGIACR
ncbi:alpha/beta hydrolase [Mesorhizobium microcysteis]|uniref:Alpha/beta hydrolase n=2 Tax=Neoaquamicrobium microcysteis TaxID=2682781 RepID=A0A5D4GZ48_9HYPH|nr:alpha/beta hydrolase [Mesorhizobium microcysteis]